MKRYSDSVADNTLLVSQNVTNLMNDIRAEDLLNDAVYYIDARDASASGQTIDNLGTAKELLPTTLGSSTSADSNDPQYLSWSGTNYVYLPGVNLNYLSVPDAATLDITGDIDLRVQVALDDWTPSTNQSLINKMTTTGTQQSFRFWLGGSGIMSFGWTNSSNSETFKNASLAVPAADGTVKWVRVTLDVDNGASGNDVKFFTSDDGSTWTQLGTTQTTAGVTNIKNSTASVIVGGWNSGTQDNPSGKYFGAQIYDGIDGTKVLDVDTSVLKTGAETSFTALTGQTVTINRSTSGRKTVAVTQPCWLFGTDDYMEVNNRYMSSGTYLYLPGISASANNATSPDSAALDITGDIDIRAKVAMDSWTDTGFPSFINKNGTASAQRSYGLGINSGTLYLAWSPDGTSTNEIRKDATTTIGLSAGTTKWVRATLDVDNGASGNTVTFYTSDDGTNWTQLGNTVTTVGVTSIFSGTGTITICGNLSTTNQFRGKVFRAQIFNGIDGTKVFDADFENKITSLEQTSFVEASSNAATVTINRSGSTYRSAGITAAGYLYPGATNTFSASATDFVDFGAADSFTVLAIYRQWANPTSYGRYVSKRYSTSGYEIRSLDTNLRGESFIADGTNSVLRNSPGTHTAGTLVNLIELVNRSAQTITTYQNNVASTTSSISSIGSPSTSPRATLRVGSSPANDGHQDAEIYAVAVFRRALTSAEITLITNYFNRRSL